VKHRNWIDRMVSFVSPKAGANRARARFRESALLEISASRKYDAASRARRTQGWITSSTSANAENAGQVQRIRDRMRDMIRNNPYAESALESVVSDTIGTGILANISAQDKKRAEAVSKLWRAWADSTKCDADGRLNFYGLQELALRTLKESGEVLVRRRPRRDDDLKKMGLPVPLQIQILEPDYLDSSKTQSLEGGGYIVQGVEFNAFGQRVAYWLFPNHPGDGNLETSRSIPAAEIAHVYRVKRPGQVRGVPDGTSVILRLRDFDDYEDAQLMRQKVAALFGGFIEDMEVSGDPTTEEGDAMDMLEPGTMTRLPPGKRISFPNTPTVSDDGHASRVLHAVAAGFGGVTYESMTGDYSQVNFSSGRMGHLKARRYIEKLRWNVFIPGFCETVFGWFLQAAALTGAKTDGVSVEWAPPAFEMIDPTKEVTANREAVRAGFKTLSDVIREQGFEPGQKLAELSAEQKLLDKLELKLESDYRQAIAGNSTEGSNDE
jgi:lambda family phage portal protein